MVGRSPAPVHALGRSKHLCIKEDPVEMLAVQRVLIYRSTYRDWLEDQGSPILIMFTILSYLEAPSLGPAAPRESGISHGICCTEVLFTVVGVAAVAPSLPEGVVTVLSWFLACGIDNGEAGILRKWWNSG